MGAGDGAGRQARGRRELVLHRAIAACVVAGVGAARATTVDPMLWQELAEKAAFIGIVECESAGGIVARYRVQAEAFLEAHPDLVPVDPWASILAAQKID